MIKNQNGYATKSDLRQLETKMERKFLQVDKRFEQVNQQFVNLRAEFKEEFKWFKHDTLREFRHEWQVKIDPILAEIERHREKEILWAEQNRRMETKLEKVAEQHQKTSKQVIGLSKQVAGLTKQSLQTDELLKKIAIKVGVNP